MAFTPRVLLVHSRADWVSVLRSQLDGDLVAAATPEEAWAELEHSHVDLVVAEDKVGAGFLEALSQRTPAIPRAILLNGGDRRPWLEAAAEGHRFVAIPEQAPDLAKRLMALVEPAAADPTILGGCTVEVATGARRSVLTGPLLSLSSDALTFRLEPGEALEDFLPGRELERVTVRRGREVLIDECAASVKSLAPDDTGGFELEMTLGSPPGPAPREEVVRDPMQRASLVGEAIRRGRLRMEGADGSPAPVAVRGRVDALSELLLVDGAPAGFLPGMAVRFSFEAGGTHYRFVSAIAEVEPAGGKAGLQVALARELYGRRRRRPRVALGDGAAAAELPPLLRTSVVRRPVVDVELEGMGILAEPGDLLPLGARLPSIRLALGTDVSIQASGRVASRALARGPSGPAVRCGVRFDPLPAHEQAALAGAIVRHAHPGLELARGLTFDTLWCFLRECGFLYPEKEERLLPMMDRIRSTLDVALADPDGPLRAILFRANGVLQGHISALRAYRATWMTQHLAVRKDGPGKLAAARAINQGGVDYLEQLPDCEWMRTWFRPNNRFPARTFGRFARLQFDPHRCDLRTYAYLVAPTAGAPEPPRSGIAVTPARPADWAEIRRHLVAAGHTASLAAEDLCAAPELSEAGQVFAAMGLERRREAWVARREGKLAGFALLEISSPGLNFSELTNAFRLHTLAPDQEAVAALALTARRRYGEVGRPIAIGLTEDAGREGWTAASFTQTKSYCCWTVHRSLLRRYVEFMDRLYECLPTRSAKAGA